MSDLMICPIHAADFSQWCLLWDGYNRFYGRDAFPDEVTKTTWSRFLDPDEPVYALVAEKNAQLVGLAHYLFHRSTSQINLTCYLQDLFTNEASRGQGVGRALIEVVCEQAQVAGSAKVYWQTHEANTVARKLYDKVAASSGFIVYEKQIYSGSHK
jgi:GNAT superfamily N-acetyltransferase